MTEMKHIYEKHQWLLFIFFVITISSCKKNDLVPTNNPKNNELILLRTTGGLLPDDPSRVAKVDVIISSSYQKSRLLSARTIKGGGGKGPDATAPNISITNPVNGASLTELVNITVKASDNVGVSSVSYTVDGTSIGSSTTAPFSISWNTSSLSTGVHTLEAKAVDAAGNWSASSISVSKNAEIIYDPATFPANFSLIPPGAEVQGFEGSCVAFAVGYSARSIEEYYKTNSSSYSYATNLFSPEFLYNQTKVNPDCNSGSTYLTALDFLKNKGVCTWQTMPYSYNNGCSLMPNASQSSEAFNYKISSYAGIYVNDIAGIKNLLINNHPVMIGIYPDNSFNNANAEFIWKNYSGSPQGGHAVTIVGYDDAKNAFKVMNSWGITWGDSGYSWIDYQFLVQCSTSSYGYSMTL
jgi:C1A family cysteine protease